MRTGLLIMAEFACDTMAGQLRGTEFVGTPVYWVNVWNCVTDSDFEAHKQFWHWYIPRFTKLIYQTDKSVSVCHTFTDDDYLQPLGNDDHESVTPKCQVCGADMTGRAHKRTCSPKCRKALSRRDR